MPDKALSNSLSYKNTSHRETYFQLSQIFWKVLQWQALNPCAATVFWLLKIVSPFGAIYKSRIHATIFINNI